MKKYFIVLLLIVFLFSCDDNPTEQTKTTTIDDNYKVNQFYFKDIVDNDNDDYISEALFCLYIINDYETTKNVYIEVLYKKKYEEEYSSVLATYFDVALVPDQENQFEKYIVWDDYGSGSSEYDFQAKIYKANSNELLQKDTTSEKFEESSTD